MGDFYLSLLVWILFKVKVGDDSVPLPILAGTLVL